MEIFTIGHSNHTKDYFLGLLKDAGIALVIDIRALPRSRWAPWANSNTLGETLGGAGISYKWLGDKLGGKPSLKKDRGYKVTAADFTGMDRTAVYKDGIRELMELAAAQQAAIMCSEEDPARCHRELVVGKTLRQKGVEVKHLRGKYY